ncbi:MAG: group 1 truncated hemoglobin [Polyangiaceae bacterium]
MTPYELAGGEAGLRTVLTRLYDRAFDDPIIGFLFVGKDKARIVEGQVAFTAAFLGGPRGYRGRPLPEAHAQLPLLPGHFDRRHRLLEEVLCDQGVHESVRRQWLDVDEGLRGSVLAACQTARQRTKVA